MDVSKWSLLGLPLRVGLAVLVLAAMAAAVLWGHWWRRLLFSAVAVVFIVVLVAAQFNAHYQYIRTVAGLFGTVAEHEVSVAGLVRNGQLPPEGKVVDLPIPGTRSRFNARNALVYLPQAWFRDVRRQLPVLLLLHGSPGFPEDWTRGGLADVTADAFAHKNNGLAPIIVMPDINGSITADSECVDSPRGNVETYLTEDVRQFVLDRFGASAAPAAWAVAGLSEGGNCGMQLVFRHPELFHTFGDYAGFSGPRPGESDSDTASAIRDLFGGSVEKFQDHEPAVLLGRRKYPGVNGWFEAASDDKQPLAAAERLVPLAKQAGVDTCLVILPGGSHTFGVFSRSFRDSLPWIAARVGLVPKTQAQTALCRPGS